MWEFKMFLQNFLVENPFENISKNFSSKSICGVIYQIRLKYEHFFNVLSSDIYFCFLCNSWVWEMKKSFSNIRYLFTISRYAEPSGVFFFWGGGEVIKKLKKTTIFLFIAFRNFYTNVPKMICFDKKGYFGSKYMQLGSSAYFDTYLM